MARHTIIILSTLIFLMPISVFSQNTYQPTQVPKPPVGIEKPKIQVDDIPQAICFENDKSPECSSTGKDYRSRKDNVSENYDSAPTPTSSCRPAYATAKSRCQNMQTTNPQTQAYAAVISQAKLSGNTRRACELSKQIYSLSWSANATSGIQCNNAIQKCLSTCNQSSAEYETCQTLTKAVTAAKNQAIENAKAYVGSEACAVAASGCDNNSYDNPSCPQYCQKPGRQNDPLCSSLAQNNCSNPQFASLNIQFCNNCLNNPTLAECVSQNLQYKELADKGRTDLLKDLSATTEYDFSGNKASGGVKTQVEGATSGSTGFIANSGQGYIPQGAEPLTAEEIEKQKKDNLLNEAMGIPSGQAGVYGINTRSYSDDTTSMETLANNEIDLKEFLPKNDYQRNPSNAYYAGSSKNNINREIQSKKSYNATAEDIVLDFSDPRDTNPDNYIFIFNRRKGFFIFLLLALVAGVVYYEKTQKT